MVKLGNSGGLNLIRLWFYKKKRKQEGRGRERKRERERGRERGRELSLIHI